MDFKDFINLKELGFLIEAPVITTKLVGHDSKHTDPQTGKSWRVKQKIEQLQKVRNEHPEEKLYVHFTDGVRVNRPKIVNHHRYKNNYIQEPKLGVNPRADDGSTPIGIYAYPIDYVISRSIPYGGDRNFMLVFKNNKKNILFANDNDKEISNFEEMLELLSKNKFKPIIRELFDKEIEKIKKIIRKITLEAKNTIKILDEDIIDHIFEQVNREIISEIDYLINDRLMNEEEAIKNIMNYFENISSQGLIRIFRSYYDGPDFIIKSKIKNYYNLDFDSINLDLENLKYKVWNDEEKKYEEKSLLKFPIKDGEFKSNLAFLIISKYKDSAFFKKLKKRIEKINNNLKKTSQEINKKREQAISNFHFPFKEEFFKITNEFGIDILESLKKLFTIWKVGKYGNNEKINASNFVYKFSGVIADQVSKSKKNPKGNARKQYVVWTSILQRIGFQGIVDNEDTGTIHGSEKTQAVFFDAKQLELVAVIKNKSDGGPNWNNFTSPYLRWFQGIKYKMENIRNLRLFSYEITNGNDLIQRYSFLSNCLVLFHSYFRFAKKINEESQLADSELKGLMRINFSYAFKYSKDFDRMTLYVKKDDKLMQHAINIKHIIDRIQLYLESNDLKTNLPKPSYIRNQINDLKQYEINKNQNL